MCIKRDLLNTANVSIVACEKHDLSRTVTDEGIQIDLIVQFLKHNSPIRSVLDSDSNITVSSLKFANQHSPRTDSEPGMQRR
jgi:hypothetical protein